MSNIQILQATVGAVSCNNAVVDIMGGVQTLLKGEKAWVLKAFYSLLWSGADVLNTNVGELCVGPMWFLIALFWTKLFFSAIQFMFANIRKHRDLVVVLACTLLAVLGMLLFLVFNPWPLCVFQSLVALVFYSIGWVVRKHGLPRWIAAICVVCWPVAIMFSKMELFYCYMKIFPIDVLGACGGTVAIYCFCKWICSLGEIKVLNTFKKFIIWCGMFSLPILCMHTFEMRSAILWSVRCRLPFELSQTGMMMFRFVFPIIMGSVMIKLPIMKKIYR